MLNSKLLLHIQKCIVKKTNKKNPLQTCLALPAQLFFCFLHTMIMQNRFLVYEL